MAGPFYNPATGMGIEQAGASALVNPTRAVPTSAADAVTAGLNAATQGVSLYAQDQRYKNRYGGTRSGRPDPNLARFSEEVQIALRNKEQFGEGRFKMDMNRIVQNFGSAGQAIDSDMVTYFEQTTGLPSDTYFGVDPVEKFKTEQFQTPEIQAAAAPLIAAGMDPEKALNQALEEQQTFTRLSENLSQINIQNAAEYMAPKGGQEIQQGIIQHFRDTVYSRLNALVNTGKATEQDARIVLSNYQSLLATPKMQIPSGVSPEVRAQEVASRNNLKGSIETVVKLLDAGEQGQSLLQKIAQNPKMSDDDKKNMFARFTLLSAKDPFLLMEFVGISDMNDLIKGNTSLGKLPPSNFELGNLNSVTAGAIAKAPPGQTPPPEEIVPPELSSAIKKMSSRELVSFTNGNAKKASFPGWDFNSQEDVKSFATSVYSVAQGLTAPQQSRLRTIDDLGKLLNRNIFKNLDSLDKVDPEQAALLRASLGVGLTTELTRRKVQLSSIEKSLVGDATSDGITTAKFNPETGKYELTPEFINSQTPEDMKSFQAGVEYAYGGDLAKGAENNFVRLTTARSPNQGPGDASKVVSDGNLIRIEDAQRNRRATAALRQFYSSLDAGGQLPPLAQEFSDPSAEARRVAATVAGTAPMDQGQTTDEGDGRSLLQRGLEMIFSPAAAAELTPELRAQLEAVFPQTDIPPLPEAELGSAEALETEAAKADRLDSSIKKEIRDVEGFRGKAYIPTPGDVPTIGYGFTKGVKIGDTMTKEEAEKRLSEEVNTRVEAIRKQIKDFDKFPEDAQVLMLSSWYRGSLSGSPKTKRLINEGKYKEAADEFLNNDEYKNAVARGRRGIRARMEKTAEAIKSLMPIGEDELNTDLSPVTEQVDPKTVTDAQFIEQMSKSLSETPTEKRVRETKARLDARTAYYKSLNESPRPSEGQNQGNFNVGLGRDPVTKLPISLTEEYPSESAVKQKIQRTQEGARNAGVLSDIVDFVPFVGDVKAGAELIDSFNEDSSPVAKGINAAAFALGVIPVAGDVAGKALKGSADDVAKFVDEFVENTNIIPEISNESPPKKVVKAYKLFREVKGKLYPLFVDAQTEIVQGKWLKAVAGDAVGGTGKVQSKLGPLAFRPGFHAGDKAGARHIGGKIKGENKPSYRPANQVWAEVEYPDDFNWQAVADSRASVVKSGPNKGKQRGSEAHITDQIPFGGHYSYKTNPNMEGKWLISGDMKVNNRLSSSEVSKMGDDLPTLPELIEQRNLTLNDIPANGLKELKEYYPDVYQRLLKE